MGDQFYDNDGVLRESAGQFAAHPHRAQAGFDLPAVGTEDNPGLTPGERVHFTTTDFELRRYSGTLVTVERLLSDDEADLAETGPMYRVRGEDGETFDVYADELRSQIEPLAPPADFHRGDECGPLGVAPENFCGNCAGHAKFLAARGYSDADRSPAAINRTIDTHEGTWEVLTKAS